MNNLQSFLELSVYIIPAVPIIIGLVGVLKTLKWTGTDNKFAPALAIVFGLGIMALVPDLVWQAIVIQGIIAGLTASGLYAGVKKTAE